MQCAKRLSYNPWKKPRSEKLLYNFETSRAKGERLIETKATVS